MLGASQISLRSLPHLHLGLLHLSPRYMASTSKGKGRGGYRGRRNEDPNVQLSKTLSSILRHNAKKEGLTIRPDGYVNLEDLLKRPKLRGASFERIKEIVETNDKQRFTLLLEPLEAASLGKGDDTSKIPVEIPHRDPITIPSPMGRGVQLSLSDISGGNGTWYIRANQGHSIKVEDLEMHEVQDATEIPLAIHGTTTEAWEKIARNGLSIMGRNHIHLASGRPGASGVISGMRTSSQVLIFVDVESAMADGIRFYISSNGVILTPGNDEGFLSKKYFSKVERPNGTPLPDTWRTG